MLNVAWRVGGTAGLEAKKGWQEWYIGTSQKRPGYLFRMHLFLVGGYSFDEFLVQGFKMCISSRVQTCTLSIRTQKGEWFRKHVRGNFLKKTDAW